MSTINEFYSGKNILVTGVTGQCGRIFLEKVLRSCTTIGQIYVLIRSRRGQSGSERLKNLLNSPTFKFHSYSKEQLDKVIPINGDISRPGFDLSDEVAYMLRKNVQLVFHIAASVRFTATFRENFESNVVGTENVLKFAVTVSNLLSFVHVSTAYSNCHQGVVQERVCPLLEDAHVLISKFKDMSDRQLEEEAPAYFEGRPNNYTFTKALAENLVQKYASKFPIAIARPAIVTNSAREPIPSFIDPLNGPPALWFVAYLGLIQCTNMSLTGETDIYPVDYLANALIVLGWRTANKPDERLKVFNLVSRPLNPSPSDYEMCVTARKMALEEPSIYMLQRPPKPFLVGTQSRILHQLERIWYHYIPAILIDLILFIVGQKPLMYKVYRKLHKAFDVYAYFSCHRWTFECENYKQLIEEVPPSEVEVFFLDIRKENIFSAILKTIRFSKEFYLKEDESWLPYARAKLMLQVLLWKSIQICLLYLLWKHCLAFTLIGKSVQTLVFTIFKIRA